MGSGLRPSLVFLPMSGLAVSLFAGVFLLIITPIQFPLLVAISASIGAGIGILVRPLRAASVTAAAALGVGAFLGTMVFVGSIFLRIGGTAYWWSAEVVFCLIAGVLHGSIAAVGAAVTNLTRRFLSPHEAEMAGN